MGARKRKWAARPRYDRRCCYPVERIIDPHTARVVGDYCCSKPAVVYCPGHTEHQYCPDHKDQAPYTVKKDLKRFAPRKRKMMVR